MPTLRPAIRNETIPPDPKPLRLQRLKNLICHGTWSGEDDIVLIYWHPTAQRWIAWRDNPAPEIDPLTEAGVTVPPP